MVTDEKKTDDAADVEGSKRGRDHDTGGNDSKDDAVFTKKAKVSNAGTSTKESVLRYDLAVAHRLVAKMGWDMLVWNHISARFHPEDNSDNSSKFLITSGTQMWNRITPSDLLLKSDNITANVIHSAVYSARSDIQAIIHLHTPAATAVSCLKCGFKPIFQDAAYFYKRVAYYDWDGVSNDEAEGPALIQAVQSVPSCNTLVLNNHGFVCFGKSVKEVFVLAYYFERCCDVQLRAMQSGGEIRDPPKAVMETAAEASFLPEFAPGNCEWEALCGQVDFGDDHAGSSKK